MEVMGGAPFIDGEWESICKILSFDQDSDFTNSISHIAPRDHQLDHHGGQGLMGLLMGNSNPSTSQCELGFALNHTNQHFSTPISLNLSQLSCFSDLSNGSLVNVNRDSSQLVQAYHDDDQMSSLTSSIGFLAHDGSLMDGTVPMINGSTNNRMDNDGDDDDANGKFSMKRKCDRLEVQADLPTSKKRPRVLHNAKIQPRKSKKASSREEEQKSSSETSDNESNGSQEVINEDTKSNPNLDGKKRANRGAATDPQSLYARKRRERINERLRILQTLVPNGTKVDISTMLEEAVNYVKFLQLQIKLLSSDDMWMYAPLAYNGFDVGHYKSFSPRLQNP